MLRITKLRKQYASVTAVDGVSFEVGRGELYGLLGPNGAGKTTTIRMILNIIIPDEGEVLFDGKHVDAGFLNSIGYLPEERGLYRKSTLLNTILYFAELKGLSRDEGKRRAYKWFERFGMLESANRKVEELSKGNQQKVQFISSVLHEPELIILDEPFSGLDPVNQIVLKEVMMELKKQGKTIIFSTHQMAQAEELCERITLINKGKVVLDGEIQEVKKRFGRNAVKIEFTGDGGFLRTLPGVMTAHVFENTAELELTASSSTDGLLRSLVDRLSISSFQKQDPSLNSIFLQTVGGEPAAEGAPGA
jgi:ABC-2 type transport system ATP-binding protein